MYAMNNVVLVTKCNFKSLAILTVQKKCVWSEKNDSRNRTGLVLSLSYPLHYKIFSSFQSNILYVNTKKCPKARVSFFRSTRYVLNEMKKAIRVSKLLKILCVQIFQFKKTAAQITSFSTQLSKVIWFQI